MFVAVDLAFASTPDHQILKNHALFALSSIQALIAASTVPFG